MYALLIACLAFTNVDFSRTYHSDTSIYNSIFAQDREARKLIVVTGPKCPACERQKPILEEIKKEGYEVQILQKKDYQGKVKIKLIPTLIFCTSSGSELTYTTGFKTKDYILKYLKKPQ